jgi:hypothetical protein
MSAGKSFRCSNANYHFKLALVKEVTEYKSTFFSHPIYYKILETHNGLIYKVPVAS